MKRLACLCLLLGGMAQAATFSIVNMDGVGEGLNDTAPFTPVGGNSATTLGQARLNVLIEAGRIWSAQLSSSVPIVVEASFDPLACSATTGTLGTAGAHNYFTLGGSPYLVPAALADSLNGQDNGGRHDIFAQFNSDVRSGNTGCLNGNGFYLGFDHATGQGIDLLAVVLHEFGHGLGFVSLVNADGTGVGTNGTQLSAFDQYVYDEASGQFWPAMTAAQRQTSTTDNGKLVFNSPSVNAVLSQLTGGISNPGGHLRLYAPTTYNVGSSVSHWDTPAQWSVGGATRSLLMEPFIAFNPLGVTDFTGCVLKDMGWAGTRCPDSTGVPRPSPLSAQSQSATTAEDTPISLTLLGTGGDGGPLTYAITSPPARGALGAPASLTSSNGVQYTYTPSANLNGSDSFAFTVSDGTTTSSPATISITITPVDDPPVANAQTLNTPPGAAANITLTGTDIEGSPLTYTVVTNPVHGTLSGAAPNLTYTPATGYSGADSFTFRVNDGTLNSTTDATVTINVAPAAAATGTSGSGSGGGGGSVDWLGLALLLAAFAFVRAPWRCSATENARSWGIRSH